MKHMYQPIKVLGIEEQNNQTILHVSTEASKEEILRYSTPKGIKGELRLEDGRQITAEQRKKIFATLRDFSLYSGYEVEYLKQLFIFAFSCENNIEPLSLSDCSLEVAREFTNYLIEFCIEYDIPLSDAAVSRTDDINKYLYVCVKRSVCSVCGMRGVIYTLDNGDKLSLCNSHYDEAKYKGLEQFEKLYKVYGIKVREESN